LVDGNCSYIRRIIEEMENKKIIKIELKNPKNKWSIRRRSEMKKLKII
jgi:hypothetical protein